MGALAKGGLLQACRGVSLSETLSGWRLTENRAMLLFNEGSFQAHWLGGCRSICGRAPAERNCGTFHAGRCRAQARDQDHPDRVHFHRREQISALDLPNHCIVTGASNHS
jgi:hypothetical protein